VTVSCAGCGKSLTVKAALAGKKGKCPQCGAEIEVPAAEADGSTTVLPGKAAAPPRQVWPLVVLGLLVLLLAVFGGTRLLRPALPRTPKASRVNVTVGCEYVDGVQESGFHAQQYTPNGQPSRWTNGHGRLVIPVDPAKPPRGLRVQLFPYRPANGTPADVRILINQRELFHQILPRQQWQRTFDLAGIDLGDAAVVEIVSDTFVPAEIKDAGPDSRTLGVDVRGVTLLETGPESK
jgi:hypothetical protein